MDRFEKSNKDQIKKNKSRVFTHGERWRERRAGKGMKAGVDG